MPELSFGELIAGVSLLLVIIVIIVILAGVLAIMFHYATRWLTGRLSRPASIILYSSFVVWSLGLLSKFSHFPGVGMVSFPSTSQLNFEGICDIFGAIWLLMLLYCFILRFVSPHVKNTNAGLIGALGVDSPLKRLTWAGAVASGMLTFGIYLASLYAETRSHLGDDYSPSLDYFQENMWMYMFVPGLIFVSLLASLILSSPISRLLSWIQHGD